MTVPRDPGARTGKPDGGDRYRLSWALPLMVSLLSVTLLARDNLDRGIWAGNLVMPLLSGIGAALLVWALFRAFSRNGAFVAVGSGLVVTWVLFGGRVEEAFLVESMSPDLFHWLTSVLALIVLPALVVMKAAQAGSTLRVWSRRAEATSLILLVLTGVPIVLHFSGDGAGSETGLPREAGVSDRDDGLPDVILIVLDAYSSGASLRHLYGLDVERFESELRSLGFSVPTNARANYTHTALAMASMLNWDYLQAIEPTPEASPGSWGDRRQLYSHLHDNHTLRFVRDRGYRVVFFSSSYPPLSDSRAAHVVVQSPGLGDFQATWIRQTAVAPLLRGRCMGEACWEPPPTWSFRADSAPVHIWRFEELVRRVGRAAQPTFYYMHVLLPHEPFVFGPQCEPAEPLWPQTREEVESETTRVRYIDQVECLNRLLLQSLTRILNHDRADPVIVIQADHGYGRFPRGHATRLEDTDPERVRDRLSAFAAYRLPPGLDANFPDSVTPVSAMRTIMSAVFDTTLPPVEDRSYWSSWDAPFDFTEVEPGLLGFPGPSRD